MRKRIKILIIIIIVLLVCMIGLVTVSYRKFKVYNPLAVLRGLGQVTLMKKEYVQIQQYPKVIIADSNILLEDFMKESGYTEIEIDDPMGVHDKHLREFQIAEHKNYILQISCKFYSVWIWRE